MVLQPTLPRREAALLLRLLDRHRLLVSTRAPARGVANACAVANLEVRFQSTHPRGVRLSWCLARRDQHRLVSIHAPRGERPPRVVSSGSGCTCFNPRPPRGERPGRRPVAPVRSSPPCFNPRPRTGSGRRVARAVPRGVTVSIHAPARGAALRLPLMPTPDQTKFQSTPPHGERRSTAGAAAVPGSSGFQSTPPCGERRGIRAPGRLDLRVSIHAPARGAAAACDLSSPVRCPHQSSTPESAIYLIAKALVTSTQIKQFQPTLSRRGDTEGEHNLLPKLFQPTPPRERRRAEARRHGRWVVSTHASARGPLPLGRRAKGPPKVFQPARGGDRAHPHFHLYGVSTRAPAPKRHDFPHHIRLAERVSIHAPERRATARPRRTEGAADVSTHAPALGAARMRSPWRQTARCFNPRSPPGAALTNSAQFATHSQFQSTSPHGERRTCSPRLPIRIRCFNSRPGTGAAVRQVHGCGRVELISTRAPVREWHPPEDVTLTWVNAFRSTLPHGQRSTTCFWSPPTASFNPRPRAGSGVSTCRVYAPRIWFQSTPPRGARPE